MTELIASVDVDSNNRGIMYFNLHVEEPACHETPFIFVYSYYTSIYP